MPRELPVEIIKHIASFLPPSSTLVHLLCLSHDVYDHLLLLLWTNLELDHVQLHSLLLHFYSDTLGASPKPHQSPVAPSPNDMLRTPWNQTTVTRWSAPPSASTTVISRHRQPMRRPWDLVRTITLWEPVSLETANMMIPFLDLVSPTPLFPALKTLRLPYHILQEMSRTPYAYDLRKQSLKLRQALTHIFRPVELVILGMEHFPSQQAVVQKQNLESGPMLWDWICTLSNDWLCLEQVTWDGIGAFQFCLVAGVRNVVRVANGSVATGERDAGSDNWKYRVEMILSVCWGRESENGRAGKTRVVWRGPYSPLEHLKEMEGAIVVDLVDEHPTPTMRTELRQMLVEEVDGVSRLKCFEYDYSG